MRRHPEQMAADRVGLKAQYPEAPAGEKVTVREPKGARMVGTNIRAENKSFTASRP